MAQQVRAGDALQGRLGAVDGVPIPALRPVQQHGGHSLSQGRGVVPEALQGGQPLLPDPQELVLREGWVLGHVRHDLQGRGPVAGHGLGGQEHPLPARHPGELAADELELLGDLLAGARGGPFLEHGGGEGGQPRCVHGVHDAAGPQHQAEGDHREAPLLQCHQFHPVGQGVPLHRRSGEGRRGSRRGLGAPIDGGGPVGAQGALRQHHQMDGAVREVLLGHPLHVLGLDVRIALEVCVQVLRVSPEDVIGVEAVRPAAEAAHGLQPADVAPLDAVLDAGNLLRRRGLVNDALQLGAGRLLHLLHGVARRRRHLHAEIAGDLTSVVAGAGALGYLLLVHQGPVQARALAIGQHSGQDREGGLVLVEAGHRGPDQVQAWQHDLVIHRHADAAPKRRVRVAGPGQGGAWWDVGKVALHQPLGLVDLEVPGDGEAGVGWCVEASEEGVGVLQGRGIQVLLGADGGPVVGMGRRIERLHQLEHGHAVGPVLVALAALVLHHVALDVEPLLVQGVQQEAHAVRLQP